MPLRLSPARDSFHRLDLMAPALGPTHTLPSPHSLPSLNARAHSVRGNGWAPRMDAHACAADPDSVSAIGVSYDDDEFSIHGRRQPHSFPGQISTPSHASHHQVSGGSNKSGGQAGGEPARKVAKVQQLRQNTDKVGLEHMTGVHRKVATHTSSHSNASNPFLSHNPHSNDMHRELPSSALLAASDLNHNLNLAQIESEEGPSLMRERQQMHERAQCLHSSKHMPELAFPAAKSDMRALPTDTRYPPPPLEDIEAVHKQQMEDDLAWMVPVEAGSLASGHADGDWIDHFIQAASALGNRH